MGRGVKMDGRARMSRAYRTVQTGSVLSVHDDVISLG